MNDTTGLCPAEQRAHEENLPVVLAIAFELLRVAEGHPTILSTVGGGRVLLRLPTPDELLALNAAARAELTAAGSVVPEEPMSRATAVYLARPLVLGPDA